MHNDFEQMPLDYRGQRAILCVGYMAGNHMAPRFPEGCGVQTIPVQERANLMVGRVYTYRYFDQAANEWAYEMGRLVKIWRQLLGSESRQQPHAEHLATGRRRAQGSVERARGNALRKLSGPMSAAPSFSPRFRPELGLPWLTHSLCRD